MPGLLRSRNSFHPFLNTLHSLRSLRKGHRWQLPSLVEIRVRIEHDVQVSEFHAYLPSPPWRPSLRSRSSRNNNNNLGPLSAVDHPFNLPLLKKTSICTVADGAAALSHAQGDGRHLPRTSFHG